MDAPKSRKGQGVSRKEQNEYAHQKGEHPH
jgi:hypothetical protein